MSSTKPRCSIIVPTHQRKDRVLKTLNTIRSQTYENLEIVVSIDGSTDGTFEAIHALEDPRIKLIRSDTPTGVANARNRGFEASSGHYVGFCDDDDFWTPGKVAGQIAAMETTGYVWSYSFVVNIDDEFSYLGKAEQLPDEDFFHQLLYSNRVPGGCSSVVCTRTAFEQAQRFDPTFSMIADWDMWLRLAELTPPAVWKQTGTLYVYHGGQMSLDMSKVAPEITAFRSKYELQRSKFPHRKIEPIEGWVAGKLWGAGKRLEAVRYLNSCHSSISLAKWAQGAGRLATRRFRRKPLEINLPALEIISKTKKTALANPSNAAHIAADQANQSLSK